MTSPAHVNEVTLALGFLASGGGAGIALKWLLERGTAHLLADASVGEAATAFSLAVVAENTQLRAENRAFRVAVRAHFRAGCPQPDDDLRSLS